jgi:hypothetical protein
MRPKINLVVGPSNVKRAKPPECLAEAWKKYGRGEYAGGTGGERVNVFIYINGRLRGTVTGTYDYRTNPSAISDWTALETWWIGVKIRLDRRTHPIPDWMPGLVSGEFPHVIKGHLREILRSK